MIQTDIKKKELEDGDFMVFTKVQTTDRSTYVRRGGTNTAGINQQRTLLALVLVGNKPGCVTVLCQAAPRIESSF